MIRPGIDPGTGPALSPRRELVAFIDADELHVVGVDGEAEESLGIAGSDPEWLDDERIAVISPDGRQILAVEDGASEPVVSISDLSVPEMPDRAIIEDFSAAPGEELIVAALFDEGDTGDEGDEVFAVVVVEAGTARVLSGPSAIPQYSVDLSPDRHWVALNYDNDVRVIEIATGDVSPVSPPPWVGTAPTWSPDGRSVAWTGDGAGIAEGPAVLAISPAPPDDPVLPEIVTGNANEPKSEFPALADWGTDP